MNKKMYLVWAHPKKDSLTAQIVDSIKKHSIEKGFEVTELDLYRSGFNPVLQANETPDWSNETQNFSQEIYDLFNELKGNDTLILVSPIWWFSFPAILKGYIDRIWNYGLAYGDGVKLPVNNVRWIALAGGAEKVYIKKGNDVYVKHYFNNGISSFCGIEDSEVEILYNTIGFDEEIESDEHYKKLFKQANSVIDNLDLS
ncbi:hypothetical protein IQ37_09210 [Chryseobacterium piperi]|uniref:Flavodoxin-like fold domain-containing protein n=1 Tax=Chryseobacterium piperi TaxID=558152 RepID=A0A086BIS8_9FLAO|nr:NAD(P)H oxidoreductase [Chryseobacterium piperi]ASW73248.2 hypothetical protein CJF12_02370 [Chryseobacterium piperi]KFF28842.1 hypothetical protein IQ37_09210 [Chryseobacterium piperi]